MPLLRCGGCNAAMLLSRCRSCVAAAAVQLLLALRLLLLRRLPLHLNACRLAALPVGLFSPHAMMPDCAAAAALLLLRCVAVLLLQCGSCYAVSAMLLPQCSLEAAVVKQGFAMLRSRCCSRVASMLRVRCCSGDADSASLMRCSRSSVCVVV